MPRELQLSDVWGVVIALGAFVVLLNWRAVWGWARGRYLMSNSAPPPAPARRFDEAQFRAEYTPNERTNEPENPPNPAPVRQNLPGTPAFVLTPDELAATARMIEHKATAEKPTKASIIWAGFALKKGDSAKYRRASEIYDALFIIPPPVDPYPTLSEHRRRAVLTHE